MKRIPLQFRTLFFPFIGLVLSLVLIYGFLNWFFIVRPNYFIRNLVVIETYIPLLIATVVVWYWLKPRLIQLNRLDVKIHGAPNYTIHKVVVFFMLFFVMHYTQIWIESGFAQIVELKTLDDINNFPKSRFYKISINSIDKSLMSYYDYKWIFHWKNKTTRQNRPTYNSEIYVVYPMFSSSPVTKESKPIIWLGLVFENETESEKHRDKFVFDTMRYIQTLDPNKFYYLEKLDQF